MNKPQLPAMSTARNLSLINRQINIGIKTIAEIENNELIKLFWLHPESYIDYISEMYPLTYKNQLKIDYNYKLLK